MTELRGFRAQDALWLLTPAENGATQKGSGAHTNAALRLPEESSRNGLNHYGALSCCMARMRAQQAVLSLIYR